MFHCGLFYWVKWGEYMRIQKKQKFKVGNQTVIAMDDIEIYGNDNGCFILNMWTQCDEEDVGVLPVSYVRCTSLQEEYLLKKDNVMIGGVGDICLK